MWSLARTLLWFLSVLLVLAGCGDSSPERPPSAGRGPCAPTVIRGTDGLFALGRAVDCRIAVDGLRREYTLYRPAKPRPGRPALVVVLHGAGGPEQAAQATRFDREPPSSLYSGALVAYPAAIDGTWNDGATASGEPGRQDDVGFIRAMIAEIERREGTDPARTFGVGYSTGGYMAHRLACSLAGDLVSVVVLHAPLTGRCRPQEPIGILQIAGTRDRAIPYAGGRTPDGRHSPAVTKATARWRRLNGCLAPHARRRGPVVRQSADCDMGHSVDLVTVRGGGHRWYGPAQPPPDAAVDATAEAWAFFASR